MNRRSIALVFVLLVAAAGPVSAHDTVGGTPDVTITVGNGLSDRDVHVDAGAIVRFEDRDDQRHRFRSRDGEGFDTGNIEPGEFAHVRLSSAGTYTYIDERNDSDSSYHGRIVVGPAAPAATDGAPTETAMVTIGDRVFQPSTTRITAGGTVTFRNDDRDQHTATGDTFDSGTLSPGTSSTQTFEEPGTYDFLCVFHPEMRGSIEVVGGAEPTSTATPSPTATPEPTDPLGTGGDANGATTVDIVDLAFDPPSIQVTTATTVRWTNTGEAPHTVTAEDASFDSGTLDSGETFEQTFATAGTFAYVCQVHPEMTGVVEVRAEGAVGSQRASAAAQPASAAAQPASADLGSLGGIALAVTMISVASALFARLLRGTVRP